MDNQFPYRLYGAQQDNSTLILPSLPLNSGQRRGVARRTGMRDRAHHAASDEPRHGLRLVQGTVLAHESAAPGQEKQYWVGAQSLYGNPGKDLIFRFQRVSPMEISPHNPRVLYYGSQYVHRTSDEGVTWETISPDLTWYPPERQQKPSGEPITIDVTGEEYYSTLYAIEESPLEPGVIWTGANDGPFHVTRDNGQTWTNVTPKDLPPGCRVATHRAVAAPRRHRRTTRCTATC